MFYIFLPNCTKIWNRSVYNKLTYCKFCENWCRERQIFPMGVNNITFVCVQTSFTASSPHPHCCGIVPDLSEAWHQFIMTATEPLVVQEGYWYFTAQNQHVTFVILFFSWITILGKLWVSTKNSEPMTLWRMTHPLNLT